MIVSDAAELFGCVLDMSGIVTALVFVALGTSMPDLFASLSAAKEDPTADAAIVNVTGSNSVNVFLGCGVPYTIAAIYWEANGSQFSVQSDGLSFSILCFCAVCLAALVLLWGRRKFIGSELGGPQVPKFAAGSTFVCFWFLFVAISAWRVSSGTDAASALVAAIGFLGVVSLLTGINFIVLLMYRGVAWADEGEAASESEAAAEQSQGSRKDEQPGIRDSRSISAVSSNTAKSDGSVTSTGSAGRKRAPVLSFGKKKKHAHHHHSAGHAKAAADGGSTPRSEHDKADQPILLARSITETSSKSKQSKQTTLEEVEVEV